MRSRPLSAILLLGWPSWLTTLALFALLCAIVTYWALILVAPRSPIAPAGAASERGALPELQLASQLFGATPGMITAAVASNIQVIGIVAAGRLGSAILAVDGKPPKAYAVGEELSASQRLSEVRSNAVVVIGVGAPIELPVPEGHSVAVLSSGADQPQRGPQSTAPLTLPPPALSVVPQVPGAGVAAAAGIAPVQSIPPAVAKPDQPQAPDGANVVHGIVPVAPNAPGQ